MLGVGLEFCRRKFITLLTHEELIARLNEIEAKLLNSLKDAFWGIDSDLEPATGREAIKDFCELCIEFSNENESLLFYELGCVAQFTRALLNNPKLIMKKLLFELISKGYDTTQLEAVAATIFNPIYEPNLNEVNAIVAASEKLASSDFYALMASLATLSDTPLASVRLSAESKKPVAEVVLPFLQQARRDNATTAKARHHGLKPKAVHLPAIDGRARLPIRGTHGPSK